jgi:hypothetical protein
MAGLPMPQEIRTCLEQRLIDIKNTVVADLKISNAEKLINLQSVPSKESPVRYHGTHVTKEAVKLPILLPDK